MNLSRKSFLHVFTAALALPWVAIEHRRARSSGRRVAPVQISAWLREWMLQPRIPVLESSDITAGWLIDAGPRGEIVEFCCHWGSEPGEARRVSPALVFRLQDSQALYVAGYCHHRRQERVFRPDRIRPLLEIVG